jgi:hypothetical protein
VKLLGQLALLAMVMTFTVIGALVVAVTILVALGLVDVEVGTR